MEQKSSVRLELQSWPKAIDQEFISSFLVGVNSISLELGFAQPLSPSKA